MKILHKYVFRVCYKNLLKSYVVTHAFLMILSVPRSVLCKISEFDMILGYWEVRTFQAGRGYPLSDHLWHQYHCVYRQLQASPTLKLLATCRPTCLQTCYILSVLFSSPSPPFKLRYSSFSHVQEWNYCKHYPGALHILVKRLKECLKLYILDRCPSNEIKNEITVRYLGMFR